MINRKFQINPKNISHSVQYTVCDNQLGWIPAYVDKALLHTVKQINLKITRNITEMFNESIGIYLRV